jgi:hypothetical protein
MLKYIPAAMSQSKTPKIIRAQIYGLEYEIFYTSEQIRTIKRLQLPRTSKTIPFSKKA